MGWGVWDYPEPKQKRERKRYTDDDEPYTDEWEEFYEDIDIDELYEADEDDLL